MIKYFLSYLCYKANNELRGYTLGTAYQTISQIKREFLESSTKQKLPIIIKMDINKCMFNKFIGIDKMEEKGAKVIQL